MSHMIPAGPLCEAKTTYCQFVNTDTVGADTCGLYHVDIFRTGIDYLGFPAHERAFPCKNRWPDGAKLIKERHGQPK